MGVLDNFRLDGKVALVTGAARGLGQGIALGLAEAGADIAALDVAPLDETGDQVPPNGRGFHAMNVDLLETRAKTRRRRSSASASRELGRLDILVNNAGIIRRAPALEFGEEDWEDVIQINLSAAFYLSQAAARHLRRGGAGRQDHQHRLRPLLPGRHNRALLLRDQGGHRQPHPRPRQRVGAAGHQRQRHRPELLHDRADERDARGR